MGQDSIIRCLGLKTNPNPVGQPDGAMAQFLNCRLTRENVIEPRRGMAHVGELSGRIDKLYAYDDALIATYNNGTAIRYSTDGGATWLSTGVPSPFAVPEWPALKSSIAEAFEIAYFTSATGLWRWNGIGNTARRAGVPKGIGFDRIVSNPVAAGDFPRLEDSGSGFLEDGEQVAYRYVLGEKLTTAGGEMVMEGAPSGRFLVANATGIYGYSAAASANPMLRIRLPAEAVAGMYFELYRSGRVPVGVQPSDELRLVYRATLTATNISNGYVDLKDVCDDDARGAFIYTAASNGEGLANQNEAPPWASAVALWRERLWLGNIGSRQRYAFSILAVGGSNGIAAGATIVVDGVTFTAVTTTPGANEFRLATGGSISDNIENTALALVNAINRSASNTTVYAFYASDEEDINRGQIIIEARLPGQAPFNVSATTSLNCYAPTFPAVGSNASEADNWLNGVAHSKPREPEAFPLAGTFRIGAGNKRLLDFAPIGDSLFVFKEDGVFRIVGDDEETFRVIDVDPTMVVLARESIRIVGNMAFALTNKGVVAFTETGMRVVSRDVDDQIKEMIADAGLDNIRDYCFAIGYESDNLYMLATVDQANGTSKEFLTYNFATDAWGRDRYDQDENGHFFKTAGIVDPSTGLLYLGDLYNTGGGDCLIHQERKTGAVTDYKDTDEAANTYAIVIVMEWAIRTAEAPGALKRWSEVEVFFGLRRPATAFYLYADNELSNVTGTGHLGDGGGVIRDYVWPEAARGAQLKVTLTNSAINSWFQIFGLAIKYRVLGPRVRF